MNVLPTNSSTTLITSSSPISAHTTIVKQEQSDNAETIVCNVNSSNNTNNNNNNNDHNQNLIKCAVCEELLSVSTDNNNHRMLAVRPSIGSKDPFFPILESLTQTSALQVPCCMPCSDSLLQQWNDYEAKNVLIKNRVYNLSKKTPNTNNRRRLSISNSTMAESTTPTNNNNNNKSKTTTTTIIVPTTSNNGANTLTLPMAEKINSSTTTKPPTPVSPQDEVLDLSMSTGGVASVNAPPIKTEFVSVLPVMSSGAVINNKASTPCTIILNTGSRSRNLSSSSNNSNAKESSTNIISPFSLNHSSMSNLIKVSSNTVVTGSLKALNETTSYGSSSSPANKKQLKTCGLCEEKCTTLYYIMLKAIGNGPYFPTLLPYIKLNHMDQQGKAGVCESCHHQLIVQWDTHQKSNKPILERHYQLIRSSSTKPQQNSAEIILNTTNNNQQQPKNSMPIAPISQSFISTIVAAKKASFVCVMCTKNLLSSPEQTNSNKSQINSHSSSPHIAFAVRTENDSSSGSNVITKLIVQSAQEINLLPFMSSTSNNQHLLQLESGRVLICFECYDKINSRHNSNNNSITGSSHSVGTQQITSSPIDKSKCVSSSNGILMKVLSDDHSSIGNLLCLACNQHKAQYLVETKENNPKKPFFPFLHDPTEPNGRARLCAPCHLMLETQWDAYENSYVPYNQRVYQLPSLTNSTSQSSTILTTRRPSLLLPNASSSSSSAINSGLSSSTSALSSSLSSSNQLMNGQQPASAAPLKIQIAVPNSSSSSSGLNLASDHLLLTTVNSQINTNHMTSSEYKNDQRIFKLMNEFLVNPNVSQLSGPHSYLSGMCIICQQDSPAGQTYQLYATPSNMVLSEELGMFPYFPMLKHMAANLKNSKKTTKSSNVYIACTYCFHSLIAQWTAYHVSSKPEDRDLSSRYYNCRDFVCYVCGVTTYRQFVRSISFKDFPFLREHKRPTGSLILNKGEQVVTCMTCYQTLIHQWVENERMKVPLEMRKYNWMAVPQPQPSNLKNDTPEPTKRQHSTVIPILTNTATSLSYQLTNHTAINHNGIISVPVSGETIPKTIIVNTGVGGAATIGSSVSNTANVINSTPTSFNPSHTLAPLVAAAMAATPVTIKDSNQNKNNSSATNSVIVSNNNSTSNSVVQQQPQAVNNHLATGSNATTYPYTDVLRQLAKQQQTSIHKTINHIQDGQQQQMTFHTANESMNNRSPPSSINLSTLASVAAMAGSSHHTNSSQFTTGSGSMNQSSHSTVTNDHHSELPKTSVFNSNSFAVHFNAPNNNNNSNNNNNNNENVDNNNSMEELQARKDQIMKQILELESDLNNNNNNGENYDESLSQVNMEVMKLREKRKADLKKLKEKSDDPNLDISELELIMMNDQMNIIPPRSSIVRFMNDVLPPPVLRDNKRQQDKYQDSQKDSFMSILGLATHQKTREQDWEKFIKSKLNSRLSKASFKLDRLQEEIEDEDILLVDPQFDPFKCNAYLLPSDINPDSDQLRIKRIKRKRSTNGYKDDVHYKNANDKQKMMETLGLYPVSPFKQLKVEVDWMAVLKNRRIRRKRNLPCIGKIYQNINDDLLNDWTLQKLSSIDNNTANSDDYKLIKQFRKLIPLKESDWNGEEFEMANIVEEYSAPSTANENEKSKEVDINGSSTSYPILTKTIITRNNDMVNNHQQIIVSSPIISSDNRQQQQQTTIIQTLPPINVNHHQQQQHQQQKLFILNSNNKPPAIINTKQFAQEFHESVLLETQKQITGKQQQQQNVLNGNVSGGTVMTIQQPLLSQQQKDTSGTKMAATIITAPNAAHTIIYSDPVNHVIRSNNSESPQSTLIHPQTAVIDRSNGILPINHLPNTRVVIPSLLKPQDKMAIRDHVMKLQVRIQDINREYQLLNDKKNEIILNMQKLNQEKTLYQSEVDRLTKCLDM